MSDRTGMEIAVLAMAGRFPRAPELEGFWQNLRDGVEAITFFSDQQLAAAGQVVDVPGHVPAGVVLEGADLFAAEMFDVLPSEAELIDPQQRLLLEAAHEALERAGYLGTKRPVGVFVGTSENTYALNCLLPDPQLVAAVGRFSLSLAGSRDYAATRLSYKLDLTGPSVAVQTACSTSLVAVHLACQSLLGGECELALAGAATVRAPLRAGYHHQPGGIASPDGRCRAFDARAQGTFPGQGVGVVVLKLLEDALADGDTIRAVIKGSAVNNDGLHKTGFTTPSRDGQAQVIRAAQLQARVEPDTIGYVEAHGTATPLGDPIEVAALTRAFSLGTERRAFCALGSVKTNVGHLDAAAGIAGLIKTVLALEHKEIPPSLHFESPNPEIDFATSPFYVNTRLTPWPAPSGAPRRAGVSSFGLGGTNAHVILEEAPTSGVSAPARPHQLVLLSARTATALELFTDDLARHLAAHPEQNLADICFTLQAGRRVFHHRRALVAATGEEAAAMLGRRDPQRLWSAAGERGTRPIAFLLPGVGDQYAGMARDLYASELVFRQELDRCTEVLRPLLGIDLREALFAGERLTGPGTGAADFRALVQRGGDPPPEGPLHATRVAQPAMLALGWSLARLWMSWGVEPQALLGYSLGEYTAACLAGVLSLEDGLALAARRAELIDRLPRSAMLAVPLPESETAARLTPVLSIAAVNAPSVCVVAGPLEAVGELEGRLAEEGLQCRRLRTAHAFHCPEMAPIADAFRSLLDTVHLAPPRIPYLSNVTGTWILADEATDPAYWVQHLLQTVRFSAGVAELWREPGRILLEMGAGQALASLALQQAAEGTAGLALSSLPHELDPRPDSQVTLGALGQLWLAGVEVDWNGFYQGEQRRRVPLPTHPFERKRFWIEPAKALAAPPPTVDAAGPLVRLPDMADWFHVPSWRLSPPRRVHGVGAGRWLLLLDRVGIGRRLAERLAAQGHDVETLPPGDPEALKAALDRSPDHVVHLWTLGEEERPRELGFSSLVLLAQSLSRPAATTSRDATRVSVVTNGLCRVERGDRPEPEKALLLGPVRVIPQEYSHAACRAIDVDLADREECLVERLLTELNGGSDPLVAWRGDQRWTQDFAKIRLPADEGGPSPLRENGVYLVTGGLGGIGLALAGYLARTVRAQLALLGRSALPDRSEWTRCCSEGGETARRIRAVEDLERTGAEILTLQADVADEQQMRRAIAAIHERFGALHGVFHAAGVPGGGLIQLKTGLASAAILAPKADGAHVLAQVLREAPPEIVVLFSSINAVTGGIGQVDYCAANAYLDAMAEHGVAEGLNVVVIDWCEWQWDAWTGSSLHDPKLQAVLAQHRKTFGLSFAEGMEALRRILASGSRRVIVTTRDLGKILAERHALPEMLAGPPPPAAVRSARASRPRPALASSFVAPSTAEQERLAALWRELLGIEEIGIHDDFFQLGGHSLLGLQLLSRVQNAFQVELPLRTLFGAPTVAELAAAIEELRVANGGTGLDKIARVDPESQLDGLEELSDDQMNELLAQLAAQEDESLW